jgi:ribonuclease HI
VKRDFAHFWLNMRSIGGVRIADMPKPNLVLTNGDGSASSLAPSATYRWLGIFWDSRFFFDEHIRQMATRADSAVTALTMLGKTTSGLPPVQLRNVHIACTLSILTFGSNVWYTGKGQKGRVAKLEVVLRKALRHILGAFKTTPTYILYIEASIPPLHLTFEARLERAAIRFASFPPEHPVRVRAGGRWSQGAVSSYPPPLTPSASNNTKHQTRLQRVARRYPHDGERINIRATAPWTDHIRDPRWDGRLRVVQKPAGVDKRTAAIAHKALERRLRKDHNNILVYTDGSLLEDAAGSGAAVFHGRHGIHSVSKGLGQAAETYDAELFALASAARPAVAYTHTHWGLCPDPHIWFFADNDAAIGRIAELAPAAGQMFSADFLGQIGPFLIADPVNRVTVQWVPGHEDLAAQEASDTLAKAGTHLPSALPVSLTITRAKREASERLTSRWRAEWLANTRVNAFSPANRIAPSTQPTPHLRTLDKSTFSRLFQCRSGHAFTGEYYRAIDKPERGYECECGDAALQTRDHILTTCITHERYRYILRAASLSLSIPNLLGTKEGIAATGAFIRKSGAFSRPATLDPVDHDN